MPFALFPESLFAFAGVLKEPATQLFPRSVDEDSSNAVILRNGSPLKFFLLVFALSIPFWLAGAATGLRLLPRLPGAALMFVCPATAALIQTG